MYTYPASTLIGCITNSALKVFHMEGRLCEILANRGLDGMITLRDLLYVHLFDRRRLQPNIVIISEEEAGGYINTWWLSRIHHRISLGHTYGLLLFLGLSYVNRYELKKEKSRV